MSSSGRRGRRRFLFSGLVAGAALGLPASGVCLADSTPATNATPGSGNRSNRSRIRRLDLLTATPLETLRIFYKDVLEFPTRLEGRAALHVDAGETAIVFRPTQESQPFYHFAFNIPENKVLAGRNWLAERTKLMQTPEHMLDPDFPADVRVFRNWNAHAIFFWDPAGNILECIGRHTLGNAAPGGFRASDMHYVSEIGLVTDDVVRLGDNLEERFGLSRYRNASETFRAVGDEHGLLLVFKRGQVAGASEAREQKWSIFPTEVSIRNEIVYKDETLPYSIAAD